jgi:hypothetical protein
MVPEMWGEKHHKGSEGAEHGSEGLAARRRGVALEKKGVNDLPALKGRRKFLFTRGL